MNESLTRKSAKKCVNSLDKGFVGVELLCALKSGCLLAVAVFCFLLTGCASRGKMDVLESRLRTQEDQISSLQNELAGAQNEALIAQRESSALRENMTATGKQPIISEEAQVLFRTAGVQINKLLTGGLNEDQQPGDDMLNVVLLPVDAQGDPVKLPGAITLELSDLRLPAGEREIGKWVFPEEDAMKNWHRGFITSGYQFKLPWQQTPQNPKLLLHARLTTPDGRQFDTSETITVTPGVYQAGFTHEQPVPAPAAEPLKIPLIKPPTAEPPRIETSVEKTIPDVTPPVGEASPWKKSTRKNINRTAEQLPLKTSDRRSDPVYEAKSRPVIR